MKKNKFSRRSFLRHSSVITAGTVAGMLATVGGETAEAASEPGSTRFKAENVIKNGRINQAASKWCYNRVPFKKLCTDVKKMGLKGIDLLRPRDFPTVKEFGLVCTLTSTGGLTEGMINPENHAKRIKIITEMIEANAEYGFPNVVVFSGNANGMPKDVGLENAVKGFKQIIGLAEKKKVILCVEYLNSKVNHKDYMFDNMAWGVELCKRIGSPNFKILYDIYHAQIMEGDIIRTIRDNHEYIGHYHTGGNPGRKEINETQELYYPAIMKAIVETGYTGYVAHEFEPTRRNPLESLAEAMKLCDV